MAEISNPVQAIFKFRCLKRRIAWSAAKRNQIHAISAPLLAAMVRRGDRRLLHRPRCRERSQDREGRSISSLTGNSFAGYAIGRKARMVCDRWPTPARRGPS